MRKRDESFEILLDRCLDSLQKGESVEDILARWPEHAIELEPLLKSAASIQTRARFEPSSDVVAAARTRLNKARVARAARPSSRTRTSWLGRLTARPVATTAITTFAVLALTAVLVLLPAMDSTPPVTPAPSESGSSTEGDAASTGETTATPETEETTSPPAPAETPTEGEAPAEITYPAPLANGNFVFYVSDEQNDIGDFESLIITISSIQIKPMGEGSWMDLTPEVAEADLVQLQGERAQELWRGTLPDGEYQTVFVYVDSIVGILADSGEKADVKLPSDKLHVEAPFSLTESETIEFVFDITVHKTGHAGQGAGYILSPQASESGAGKPVEPIAPQDKSEQESGGKPGEAGDHPGEGVVSPLDVVPPGPGPSSPNAKSNG